MIWSRAKRTILIIGSAARTTALHPAFLRQSDIRLITARDAPEAIDLARRERPSLIVDQVSERNGYALDLCRCLKADPKTRRIPLISIVPPELATEAEEAGTDAWLQQPLVQDDYFETIRRFIRLPERKHPRLEINLRVSYRFDEAMGQAFTRNISLNGALLKTDRRVPDGARIQVTFSIPGEASTIQCDAIVHRTDPTEKGLGPSSGFAIEFDDITAEDRDRIADFIGKQTRRAHSLFP